MSTLVFAFFYLVMFVIASVFSALGQGGGVLYTPVQLFFGIEFHTAATTSLFLIMVMSLSATMVFRKAEMVDRPLAIELESSTTGEALRNTKPMWR
ncbi:MAG: TSUP family transporter [Acidobacteriota bacterium]